MRTLTVKQSKGEFVDKFPPGWHTLTISEAEYGEFNDSKYITFKFAEYAEENINCRIWAKSGKEGEEFAIGRLFRFANAGIQNVSKSDEGDAIITIDDSPNQLIGKKINVYFYKSETGYTECLGMVAPTEFTNDLEAFSANDVKYWKGKAERYYNNYVNKDKSSNDNSFIAEEPVVPNGATQAVKTNSEEEIPW